ncbi:alpha/beta hydrolase [Flagellimonas myxillae]|uniref:alpha/beta hydrolase n=1 Tax=Flagellimonas myxillae TaxID=2942214 RepID=UPI00201F3828|nr:hypothetical protein [Muricauda myxillae]MCL6265852.1 hypothetical protein [Muricauda myxillae]
MKTLSFALVGALLLMGSCKKETQQEPETEPQLRREISFYTPDSIQIIGDLFELDKKGKTILLFHQGGSNARAEYTPIIPRLLEKGYNILAIDQRVGGQYYGQFNRTLANIPTHIYGDGYGYCDAFNNLESALDYVIDAGFTGEKIIWGSSYSATLVVQLASKRQQDIQGALSFSPATGGSLKNCLPDPYFETVKIPLLLLSPPNEMEDEDSQLRFEKAASFGHQTFVPQNGIHGSSMLVAERVGTEVEETWKVVLSFLEKI